MNPFGRIWDISLKKLLLTRTCDTLRHVTGIRYSQKTEPYDPAEVSVDDADVEYYEDDFEVDEEAVEEKRNKSRLNVEHRNILYDCVPYPEPVAWFHHTVKYKQKMYGLYGEASGVNPGIMWPTREQLADIREYESVAYPDTLQEMISKSVQAKLEKEQIIKNREEEILKKMEKLEQWKREVNDRIRKKEAEARAAKEKKDRLVEEVRQHFGYKVDPRDERFKELLEKKEKEEKKLAKEAKRKDKEAKALAKLMELGTKPTSATTPQE
ncbi:large ribosomal subunit protein mL64 [Anabrus simplex]|uniref:large ribosomal subunit protein mL64 n=1 Tax=Anabrus simplex TaxID=316456 RepID=UPI0034DD43DB